MKETRVIRQQKIRSKKFYLSTLLKLYPRFTDYEGLLILEEYTSIYENQDVNFLDAFKKMHRMIFAFAKKNDLMKNIEHIKDNGKSLKF